MDFRKFFKKHWLKFLLGILFAILLFERAIPYILHGPFGFGYDTGIYKHTFDGIQNFSDIFTAQTSPIPALLAYLTNLLHLPMSIVLYYLYIFFCFFIAVPLYLLAKECFNKETALLAVVFFTVSYTQIFAADFYLFKAILGAIFLLFAFYYYIRKSKLFYLFTALLMLTQLPQILILGVGVLFGSVVDFKKNLKFNLTAVGVFVGSFLLLSLMSWPTVSSMFIVFWKSFTDPAALQYSSHSTGLFFPLNIYLKRDLWLFLAGEIGIILAYKNGKTLPLISAVVFLIIVVFDGLFFANRFIVEMSLLLIIFGAYMFTKVFVPLLKKVKILRFIAAIVLVVISSFATFYYFNHISSTLTKHEIGAIKIIEGKPDGYSMVVDTFYAPWLYGFSGKIVLAPGIFESIWNFEQFMEYQNATEEERIKTLLDLSDKYGKIYLFEGIRQRKDFLNGGRIKKIYDVYGARVYEIDPSSS